jgi:two-component system cell cycle response regulator
MQARVKTQVRRKRYQDVLRASQKENITMAAKDGLTGLYNRRYFDIHIQNMITSAKKKQKPLGLLLLDIDHFKFTNDQYGHLAGDAILKQIGPRILSVLRATDLVARYGGEEFCVIMPDTPLKYAKEVSLRIRRSIISHPFPIPTGTSALKITVSMGLTLLALPDDTPQTMLQRADEALYMVKKNGRNNIAVNMPKKG